MTGSEGSGEALAQRIGRRIGALSPAERRVAEYLWKHPGMIVLSTAAELAEQTGTSDATVVRTVKALGYAGLPELKRAIGHQVVSDTPAARLRREVEQAGGDTAALLDELLAECVDRLTETRRLLAEPAFTAAVELFAEAEEVIGYGLGLSELPMRYLAMRLRRLGWRARSSAATGFRLADDLLPLGPRHLVVLNAPQRLLPDLRTLVGHARSAGAKVLLLTDSLGATLDSQVDVTLTAVYSPSRLTAEGLTAAFVLDCLLLALAKRNPAAAAEQSELLNSLRGKLVPGDLRSRRS